MPARIYANIPISENIGSHILVCVLDGFTAEMPVLLNIVNQEINDLARNAKHLCGIQRVGTGSNWL
jgi:hypothetical protein